MKTGDKITLYENLGEVKNLKIYFKGSGNPQDDHEIIGISYTNSNGIDGSIGIFTLDDIKDAIKI